MNFVGYIGIFIVVKLVRFRICLRFIYINLNYLLWEFCLFCRLGIWKGMFILIMNERFNMDGGYIGKLMF